jgi:peroxiredoxin
MIPIGSVAPDFSLRNQHRELVRLSDLVGRENVVVAFHPLCFTPVCALQMQTYERHKPKLDALGARVLSISVDSDATKKGWADSLGGISYDLLSDFHPKGHVAELYGVMRDDGISERAIFIVDKSGRIAWAKKYDIPEQPDVEELLKELAKLKKSARD